MMEIHEEIVIWKIKKSKSSNAIKQELCDLKIESNHKKLENLKNKYYQLLKDIEQRK